MEMFGCKSVPGISASCPDEMCEDEPLATVVSAHNAIAGALTDNGLPLCTNGAELSTATKTLSGISALLTTAGQGTYTAQSTPCTEPQINEGRGMCDMLSVNLAAEAGGTIDFSSASEDLVVVVDGTDVVVSFETAITCETVPLSAERPWQTAITCTKAGSQVRVMATLVPPYSLRTAY